MKLKIKEWPPGTYVHEGTLSDHVLKRLEAIVYEKIKGQLPECVFMLDVNVKVSVLAHMPPGSNSPKAFSVYVEKSDPLEEVK